MTDDQSPTLHGTRHIARPAEVQHQSRVALLGDQAIKPGADRPDGILLEEDLGAREPHQRGPLDGPHEQSRTPVGFLQGNPPRSLLKRSLRPGFAGVVNDLSYNPKCLMLFGNAKDSLNRLLSALK
jgi:hypothetical protein